MDKSTAAKVTAATEYLRANVEKDDLSGYVRVTKNGEVLLETGFGYADREKQIPVTADTAFSFYSLSKPFCAIALMTLFDRGLVDLDAHPGTYIPEAKGFDRRMTLRQILTHTSGAPDFELDGIDDGFGDLPMTPAEMREKIAYLATFPQAFLPGTGNRYSNVNFNLAALTVENLSGMPYAEYMKQTVFAPLGMKTAVVDSHGVTIPNRAVGYGKKDGVILPLPPARRWMFGAGDIVGTASDVYCLRDAIMKRRLLSDRAWNEVLTPSPINRMGFGCTLLVMQGQPYIRHNGGHTGFRTYHVLFPDEDLDIILLFNLEYADPRIPFAEKLYDIFGSSRSGATEQAEPDKGYI